MKVLSRTKHGGWGVCNRFSGIFCVTVLTTLLFTDVILSQFPVQCQVGGRGITFVAAKASTDSSRDPLLSSPVLTSTSTSNQSQESTQSDTHSGQMQGVLSSMKSVLSENSEYRKLQDKLQRDEALANYKFEEGNVNVDESTLYTSELKRLNRLYERKKYSEVGAVTSSAIGGAGLLGLWALNRKGDFAEGNERIARKQGNVALISAGVLGSIGLAASLWSRWRTKKKIKALDHRLVRMEKEAYAGYRPGDQPVLGVDEETPEMKRHRKRQAYN